MMKRSHGCAPCTGKPYTLALLFAGCLIAATSNAQEGKKNDSSRQVTLLYNKKIPAHLNVASAQSVQGDDIKGMPGNRFESTLAGRLPGLYVNQTTGRPGVDAYALSLRGQSPLIVIDGVPRNYNVLDYSQIESITVLKDALATAMYGPQASNGVLLITTRKGQAGRPRISITAQTGVQQPMKQLKGLNAYDYATLYNEALANDNQAPVYTQQDLDAYKNHTDPLGHPDINWQDEVFRKSSRVDRLTVNVSGGNNVATYFVTGEYLNNTGIFNAQDINTYNTNNSFQNYSIRSNINVALNDKTDVGLNIMGMVLESNEPGTTSSTIITDALATPNNAYPIFNPDGSLAGNQQFQDNLYAQLNNSGYRQDFTRNMASDLYLKRNLDDVLKGLWVKGMVSFSGSLSQNTVRNKTFATYRMNIDNPGDTSYTKYGNDGVQNNNNSVDNQWRQGYVQFEAGYNSRFGKHGIDALALYSQQSYRVNSDLPLVYKGFSGRVAYNWDEKYLAEVVFGYNGANRYPEGFRYALYPAAGLGWNLHKENFLKRAAWINRLKLYGSFGKTGNNRNGYYSFNQYYFDGDPVYFGTTPSSRTTMDELVLANPFLDYEKAYKLNVGLEGAFLKDRLSFSVEYYNNYYFDLLRTRGKSSAIIGNSYPAENIGSSRYTGVDMNVTWSDQLPNFAYHISANVSIAQGKYADIDEVYQPYDWMKRTGRPVGQAFGYTAVGFFQTTEDLWMRNGTAVVDGYTPQLGDVMYKDLDGDGVITQFDESPIGNTKPLVYFGTTLGATFKNFDFSALVQGAVNRNIVLTGATEWEFQNGGFGQAYEHHLGRWTPGSVNATYPRLSIGSNPNNHVANSSLWYHNGNYARLKFVELGYTVSGNWIKKAHLESFRLFANATNVLTVAAYDRVDPEVYGNVFPIQRTLTAGLTLKF